jgi:nucleoid-associated protein YgaU
MDSGFGTQSKNDLNSTLSKGRDALDMTREHKLALILGFALVLVVGVLVSDHISGTQRSVASTQSMDDPVRAIESELGPGLGRVSYQRRDRPLPGLDAALAEQLANEEASAARLDEVLQRVRDGIEGVMNDPPPHAAQTVQPADTPSDRDQVVRLPAEPEIIDMGSRPNEPRVPTAGVRTHRVEKGETLWSIAEKYYDDGATYRKLAQWNEGRVGSGGTIRPGASLIIPSRAELDGVVSVARPDAARIVDPIRPSRPEADTGRVYIVKRGDVLSTIAQRELGTIRRMDEILRLNRDKIKAADEIWVGLELKLPSR